MTFAPNFFGGSGDATLENQEAMLELLEQIAGQTATLGTPAAIGGNFAGTPIAVYATNRVTGSGTNYNVEMFTGETQAISIPSANLTSTELLVSFQELNTPRDVATVANASITKTTSSISFAMPAKVRSKPQTLRYSVRRASNKENLIYGTWKVTEAALPS